MILWKSFLYSLPPAGTSPGKSWLLQECWHLPPVFRLPHFPNSSWMEVSRQIHGTGEEMVLQPAGSASRWEGVGQNGLWSAQRRARGCCLYHHLWRWQFAFPRCQAHLDIICCLLLDIIRCSNQMRKGQICAPQDSVQWSLGWDVFSLHGGGCCVFLCWTWTVVSAQHLLISLRPLYCWSVAAFSR